MSKTPLPLDFDKSLTLIGAKNAMKGVEATSTDLWMVPPKYLHSMDGFNARITEAPGYAEDLEELISSIMSEGFYKDKPLGCIIADEGGEKFVYVVEGHRRLGAVKIAMERGAEIAAVPVVIKPPGTSLEDLTVGIARSASGSRPLTPLELGILCHRLVKFGWDEKKIADRIGKTPRYIADLLVLVAAPAAVRNLVIQGKVASTLAIKAVREHGGDAPAKLKAGLDVAEAAGKTRATGKHIEKKTDAGGPARAPATPRGRPAGTVDFLVAAIDYALTVATDGLAWLKAWNEGDLEVLAELEAHMGQPEGATNDPSKRVPLQPAMAAEEPAAVEDDNGGL